MKKVLAVLAGGVLLALLAACDLSSYFKPKSAEQPQQQQPAENPPPAPEATPAPPPEPTPAPAEPAPTQPPPVKHKPAPVEPAPSTAPEPAPAPPAATAPVPTVPPVKVKKGGLGVIFIGNLEQGQFRVKVDKDVVYELAFSGKETRATKELLIEPGQHMVRFAVIDAKNVRGVKEETFNIVSGSHQTVRVTVKDTPGAIVVEHLD